MVYVNISKYEYIIAHFLCFFNNFYKKFTFQTLGKRLFCIIYDKPHGLGDAFNVILFWETASCLKKESLQACILKTVIVVER